MRLGTRGFGLFARPRVPFLAEALLVGLGLAVAYAAPYLPAVWDRMTVRTLTATGPELTVSGHFSVCSGAHRVSCVVDGDTVWVRGEKIRIADIDAPEVFHPLCAGERRLGTEATARLVSLINAGPFELKRVGTRDRDVYGRALRLLVRNGRSLGTVLVSEGLAHRWDGAKHSWCG